MTPFIESVFRERKLGLALHYPMLHAVVVGIGATTTFEFGAGGSTRVVTDALCRDGKHYSCSTEARETVAAKYEIISGHDRWTHVEGKSESLYGTFDDEYFDLVLHDGSHAADVVAADIKWVWPKLKKHGLLLVHDTLHSYCGAETMAGVLRSLPVKSELVTLPFGFGLTVIRKLSGVNSVLPVLPKLGGEHVTRLD